VSLQLLPVWLLPTAAQSRVHAQQPDAPVGAGVYGVSRGTIADGHLSNASDYLSVLKQSASAFHSPSFCFFQATRYLPTTVAGLPLSSFIVSSNVPMS
jgi:hypothetical protein